ncbi:MAG: hypothetical protein K0S45_1693 [Nitrospira sp.]|nr:hypothetical protein [Nitrospira sp.]
MPRETLHTKEALRGGVPHWLSVRAGVCLAFSVLLCCCSGPDTPPSKTTPTNRPPSLRMIKILPHKVSADDSLSVQVEADHPDRKPLTFRHQWFINDMPREEGPTLSGSSLKRGDYVAVEVVASDETMESPPLRSEASIVVNATPRIIRIEIKPVVAAEERGAMAEVEAVDADGDEIQYSFSWWANDKLVLEGPLGTLSARMFQPGDVLVAEVTAHDAQGQGIPSRSAPLVIANSPPLIESSPINPLGEGPFEYMVRATDPEGKALSFSLEMGPPGMVINKMTGKILWEPPPGTKGTYPVKVIVVDNEGARAFQEFTLVLG